MAKVGGSTNTSDPTGEGERRKVSAQRALMRAILAADNAAFDKIFAESGHMLDPSFPSSGKTTPLHSAAALGHRDMCDKLLAKKANLEAKNGIGFTPLISASVNGHESVVTTLLKAGASMNVTTARGDTAASLATQKGFSNVAGLLK